MMVESERNPLMLSAAAGSDSEAEELPAEPVAQQRGDLNVTDFQDSLIKAIFVWLLPAHVARTCPSTCVPHLCLRT